ncbi:transglutaminase TgpA family protein [Wenzhouxiangella marina]|uniref:transglutaminase TgpA family protein n=1 Tax=Wenzhouxiangella marina TaxID=1579979 RepID=UPI0014707D43|nr:DUF3488 and transglutaminase-like domain-containing protein [Wenzhouxiangella marina]MBB6086089.1 transglutaminase-like putative cysteine protease [Wenzhouxiangella marina]
MKQRQLPTPPIAPLLWTIAAFAVAAAPHLAAVPLQIAIAILALLGWRIAAALRGWRPIPAWLRVLITLGLLVLVGISFGGLWGRRTATALLCIMLAAKMMELYRVRDLRLVASVSFFLIATQFLFDESLIYLAYLILGCWIATLALVRIQQIRNLGQRLEDRGLDGHPMIAHSARLLALSLPVALVLFVLFPRLAQPLWGLPDDALDGKTGLSETMSPGSIASLYADDSPAFRVVFESGRPPPPQQRYWRGPVLWQFDGTTWERAYFSLTPARTAVPIDGQSIRYEVQLEPHERRWLLALDYPAQSNFPGSKVTADYQLVSRQPLTSLTAYDVISNPNFQDSPELGQYQRSIATRLPSDRNPRTVAMAQEWRERYPDDLELIQALLRWFREEPFFYSLETAPLGRHSADEFLFDLRTGYCEYYSSAFAIFLRAAGIPTRVVTGYQGGYWNEGGQYMLVRQSDAHAWNEVWLEGRGWTRFDPTAAVSPSRIQQGSASALDDSRFLLDLPWVNELRNRIDRIQHLWNQWVLGFDAQSQLNLLKRLGLPELSSSQIGLLMILVLLAVTLPLSLMLLREARRQSSSPVERAWRHLQRRLGRRGLGIHPSEAPLEWAARIACQLPEQREEIERIAQEFRRAHYGPNDPQRSERFIEASRRFRLFDHHRDHQATEL